MTRLLIILIALLPQVLAAEDMAARVLADRMIAAHGGLAKWNAAPAISFRTLAEKGDDTMTAVVQQGSRRTYMEWPDKGSTIAADGAQVWSMNWKEQTPPRFLVNLHYYFLGLPFFTRDTGVHLELAGEGKLPGEAVMAKKIRMSFDAGVGESCDEYLLFIDPSTHLLRGIQYTVTHPAILPPGKTSLGPFYRMYEDYQNIDGIKLPMTMRSVDASGVTKSTTHFADVSLKKPFDETKMARPELAVSH